MRVRILLTPAVAWLAFPLAGCGERVDPEMRAQGVEAFGTVFAVFRHPRCQNCHIEGDAPLQFDAGLPHAMLVSRGPDGHGAPGLPCGTCHAESNPPASFGANAPPGAPHWGLPPPEHRMAWFGLGPAELCKTIKSKRKNGGRDLAALTTHVSEDALVLWGWDPGGERAPVSVPHEEFVAEFERWAAAGGPCPSD